MASRGGFLIGCGGGKRADRVEQAIEFNQQFTTVVDTDISITRAELAFVSLSGEALDFVGLVRPGRKVATGQKTVSVAHLIPLGIPVEAITSAVEPRFASRMEPRIDGVNRLPPKTWEALLSAVRENGDNGRRAVKATTARVLHAREATRGLAGGIQSFEHDAVATALQTWGGTRERRRILRSAALPKSAMAPFLSRLSDVSLREDPQIAHDAETLPGMDVARRYQIGIAVLENSRDRLTIINCNRQRLEETLGVDLVYYNHRFDSFVLVQYKRLQREHGKKDNYRPRADRSYRLELQRMVQTNKELCELPRAASRDVKSFRLLRCPFFFKLCSDRSGRALEEGMVSGMYLPLALWRKLLRSELTLGKRGGRVLNWDNCWRRLSNSEFTSLLRDGWIGSSAEQSKALSQIIEASLSAKKMVVYAATSASSRRDDYLRDDIGRFASEDDPLAFR